MHSLDNTSTKLPGKLFHKIAGEKQLDVWYAPCFNDFVCPPLQHGAVTLNTAPEKQYPFFTFKLKNIKTKQKLEFSIDDQCIRQIFYLLEDERLGSLAGQALSVHNALRCVDYERSNYYVDGIDGNVWSSYWSIPPEELTVRDIESSSTYWQLLTFYRPIEQMRGSLSKMHLLYRWRGNDGKKAKKTWRIQIDEINEKRNSHLYYDMSTEDFGKMINTITEPFFFSEPTSIL